MLVVYLHAGREGILWISLLHCQADVSLSVSHSDFGQVHSECSYTGMFQPVWWARCEPWRVIQKYLSLSLQGGEGCAETPEWFTLGSSLLCVPQRAVPIFLCPMNARTLKRIEQCYSKLKDIWYKVQRYAVPLRYSCPVTSSRFQVLSIFLLCHPSLFWFLIFLFFALSHKMAVIASDVSSLQGLLQKGNRAKGERQEGDFSLQGSGEGLHHCALSSILWTVHSQKCVTWPLLAAKEAGKNPAFLRQLWEGKRIIFFTFHYVHGRIPITKDRLTKGKHKN